MACSEAPTHVTFNGGFVADLAIVRRLWDIEARGCSFHLEDGGRFRVDPPSVLTPEDTTFLKAHRDEVRQVLAYQVDDSHLFTDQSLAQPGRLPDNEPQKVGT